MNQSAMRDKYTGCCFILIGQPIVHTFLDSGKSILKMDLFGFWGKFYQKERVSIQAIEMNQSATSGISTYFLKGKVKYTGCCFILIGQPIVHTFLDSGKSILKMDLFGFWGKFYQKERVSILDFGNEPISDERGKYVLSF